jgi:hypothetical protein
MSITVNRKPLTFWEKLYLPAIVGGLKVTLKHAYSTLIQGKVVRSSGGPCRPITGARPIWCGIRMAIPNA